MKLGKKLHCLLRGHRYCGIAMPKRGELPMMCVHCGKQKTRNLLASMGKWVPMVALRDTRTKCIKPKQPKP